MHDLVPARLPDRATAAAALRMVQRLTLCAGLAAGLLAAARMLGVPLASLPLAALLVALAGLAGTWAMAWARRRGDPALVGRTARWPQALLVVPLCRPGRRRRPAAADRRPRMPPEAAWRWGGAMIVLAFPLLVAERVLAACPAARLPEAPALRALLFLPTVDPAGGRGAGHRRGAGRAGARRASWRRGCPLCSAPSPPNWRCGPPGAASCRRPPPPRPAPRRTRCWPGCSPRAPAEQPRRAGAAASRHRFRPQLGARLCPRRLRAARPGAGAARPGA